MKSWIGFLIRLFTLLILASAVQKFAFFIVNHPEEVHLFPHFTEIFFHGLRMDIAVACYVTTIPLVVATATHWIKKMDLRRWLTPYYIIVAIIFSTIGIADGVVYIHWGCKIDACELMYARRLSDVTANLRGLESIGLLLFTVVTCFLMFWAMQWLTPRHLKGFGRIWHWPVVASAAGLMFLGMRGGVSQSTMNPSYAYFSTQAFLNHTALNPVFNMSHSLLKSQNYATQFQFYDISEADRDMREAYPCDTNVTTKLLSLTRPDILMIVVEGFGNTFADDSVIASQFHRLRQEGLEFTSCHANSFRTDRGIIALLNGWPSLPTTSLMKRTDICRRLPSLIHVLSRNEYMNSFWYGGDVDFTNMRQYLQETGFDRIQEVSPQHSKANHKDKPQKKQHWGTPDEDILTTNYLKIRRNKKHRFDMILTLSSHEPWDVPFKKFDDERQNSFAYTDSCLGIFIDKLQHTSTWSHTLVIITADHGCCISHHQPVSDVEVSHIPLLLTGGALCNEMRGQRICTMMNQSDIVATLMAQLHIQCTPIRHAHIQKRVQLY